MQAALKAVEEGESISKAARDHGVQKTTLFDRISGRVALSGVAPPTAVSVDTHTLDTSPSPTLAQSTPSLTIAKYLTTPQVATPSGRKGEPPHARLLTSATVMQTLNEKERNKQEEIEMKEWKRKEREEMKKKRKDEQRKKSQGAGEKGTTKSEAESRKGNTKGGTNTESEGQGISNYQCWCKGKSPHMDYPEGKVCPDRHKL